MFRVEVRFDERVLKGWSMSAPSTKLFYRIAIGIAIAIGIVFSIRSIAGFRFSASLRPERWIGVKPLKQS